MSIDLQDPVSVGRAAGEVLQRRASEVADRARDVDLHAPVDAVKHARQRADRAAKLIEKQAGRASKRAAKRVRDEAGRASAPRRPTGRRLVLVVVVLGTAAAVVVAVRRKRESEALAAAPDPFGQAVAAVGDAPERDGASMSPV
jgi:hypothetical protein